MKHNCSNCKHHKVDLRALEICKQWLEVCTKKRKTVRHPVLKGWMCRQFEKEKS